MDTFAPCRLQQCRSMYIETGREWGQSADSGQERLHPVHDLQAALPGRAAQGGVDQGLGATRNGEFRQGNHSSSEGGQTNGLPEDRGSAAVTRGLPNVQEFAHVRAALRWASRAQQGAIAEALG